jgi:hypothetical protein
MVELPICEIIEPALVKKKKFYQCNRWEARDATSRA